MVVFYKRLFYKYIGKNGEFYNWFLVNMLLHPRSIYETTRIQFSLTQQWHRRDHSITKLVVLINFFISVLFALTFVSPIAMIPFIIFDVAIPFVLGLFISITLFYIIKKSFTTGDIFTVRYSYDVHINSYYCYLFVSKILMFIFSPLLFQKSWIATIASNLLNCFADVFYIYVTYLGYAILPHFKIPSKAVLTMIGVVLVFYGILTLCNVNLACLIF